MQSEVSSLSLFLSALYTHMEYVKIMCNQH